MQGILMRKMTLNEYEKKRELEIGQSELSNDGRCPTCVDNLSGKIYKYNPAQLLFSNELFDCILETYPRNDGHVILLPKEHYEDITYIPPEIAIETMHLVTSISNAIKEVLNAKKVYLCSMCDAGFVTHFHVQLIPRYDGDITGEGLFSKERGSVIINLPIINKLKYEICYQYYNV